MQKNLNSYFNDFIIDRVNDIELQIINHNEEVEELSNDSRELFYNIMKALPKKYKKMIFTYKKKTNQTNSQYFRIIYKQGFLDGLEAVKSIFYKFE